MRMAKEEVKVEVYQEFGMRLFADARTMPREFRKLYVAALYFFGSGELELPFA